jgi:hypothetical protein
MVDDRVWKLARFLKKIRECEPPGFPCPFCYWTGEANEESGCLWWAEKFVKELDSASGRP